MDQNKNIENYSKVKSKKIYNSKSKRKSQSAKKYDGYNFNFSKEKSQIKLSIEEEFKSVCEEYEIVKLLGQGSYGSVVKVKNINY